VQTAIPQRQTALPRAIRLDADVESVAVARRFVAEQVAAWDLDRCTEDVQLVVDELVSNALRHARSPITVTIGRRPTRLVVQVEDRSSEVPEPYPAESRADHGWGLVLIASLASSWGSTPLPGGKRVWAEIDVA
jgi:anti-sigma regulatory factor (Ser/Thr protein kinase)